MKQFPLFAVAAVGTIVLLALLAPLLPLPNPVRLDVAHRLAPPSALHPLGQDELGRDELSRLIWGARASLTVAFASAGLACLFGTALGTAGGFFRGVVEFMTMRSIDVVLCFPPILLALLIVTIFGPGVSTLIPVLALLFLPGFTRVAYAGVLSARALDYVEAMRALGAGPSRIMARTILPNIGGPILVQFSLAGAAGVLIESGLSFLGLGVVPPTPSWGLMIASARSTINQAPLLLLWPCIALSATVLAMNMLCDGLRDWADPHVAPSRRRHRLLTALLPSAAGWSDALLRVSGLAVAIDTVGGASCPVRDVSLDLAPGETLALVGESGCGKSLTGLAVEGLLPDAARLAGGAAWLDGRELFRLDEAAYRRLRGRDMAMIFQDPGSCLNPVHPIGAQIVEAILAHRPMRSRVARREAVRLLERVGIPDPEARLRSFPHELSGGMRQRVMIAIAIANNPRVIIADEPTTALDVTIQAQVLDLLRDLRRDNGMALLFITHNLSVAAEIAERVAVMYAGEIVEEGRTTDVFVSPLHPYTTALLASAPREGGPPPRPIPGTVPAPHQLSLGCAFAPRCSRMIPACWAAHPALHEIRPGHSSRCIRARET